MTKFSRDLENHIYNSELTVTQLSKASGFVRSYISQMKNGTRLTADMKRLEKLFEALGLSSYEEENLWKEYWKAKKGKIAFEEYELVQEILQKFGKISKLKLAASHTYEIPDIRTLNNKQDINTLVGAVLETEAAKEEGEICIVVQPDYRYLMDLIPGLCTHKNKLAIEQIICLESNSSKEEEGNICNLSIMNEVVPALLESLRMENYCIHYYYDNVKAHFNETTVMPYFILTTEYVIAISYNYEEAIIMKNSEYVSVFRTIFQRQKSLCQEFILPFEGNNDLMNWLLEYEISDMNYICVISAKPCITMFFKDKMQAEETLHSEKYPNLIQKQYDNGKIECCFYFKENGMEAFIEEGFSQRKKEGEKRRRVVAKIIEEIKNNKYKIFMPKELDVPENLSIYIYGESAVAFSVCMEGRDHLFYLNEKTIARNINEYVEYLKERYLARHQENEDIGMLEKILKKGNIR